MPPTLPKTRKPVNPGSEQPDINALMAEVKATRELVAQGRKPARNARGEIESVAATAIDHEERKRHGFKSFSEYVRSVQYAGSPNGRVDKRLYTKASGDLLSEGTAADGGYLVPPEFANTIWTRMYENDLISRTTKMTCSGNTLKIPAVDETSRVDGSRFGGIQAFWEGEAQQFTESKPKFRYVNLNLKKLTALGFVTDELLSDAMVNMEQYLFGLFAQEMTFKVGDALINGDGTTKPIGLLNSPSLVSVSAEPGQAAATILTENIVKMAARLYAPYWKNAVWLCNQDINPQLHLLTLGVGTGGVVTYLPPGGLSNSPYGTLYGRPVIHVEFCPTLGTVGDIILTDLSQIVTLTKGSPEQASSMHLRFDFDLLAFRVIFRLDSGHFWQAPLTPFKGTAQQSWAIVLATRS
jgi:HK97 family phage major capsid protein